MKFHFKIFLFVIVLSAPIFSSAQHYYRIKADFSFKYKGNEKGESSLVMGTAYFDKIEQKITYRVKFPYKQVWVMHDTTMYKFEANVLLEKSYISSPVETSIFNLALRSTMNNFGLETSAYTLKKVENEGGMVISTWKPPRLKGAQQLGEVLIANREGHLSGIVFKNDLDEVIGKQFYENYTQVSGVDFPQEVTHIMFQDGKKTYQVTNYKNIVIDELGEDHWYRYPVQ